MRQRIALTLAAALCAATVTVAPAATPATVRLDPSASLATWTGSFAGGEHLPAPLPDARCLEGACDVVTLEVALGAGAWTEPGAVEVAIRWAYDGVIDLDLVVRDAAGAEVARSEAVDSGAESVFLTAPPDGTYTVEVIPTNTANPDAEPAPIPYEGLAQVEPLTFEGPVRPLLPNLVSTPPDGFHIATAANLLPFPENPLLSCYPEETIESPDHPTRCLRFNQTIANTGAGPLELRFDLSGAAHPDETEHRMLQRVSSSDGSWNDRLADFYELHAVHGHVHYRGFGQSVLYPYDPETGTRTGDGTPAKRGSKVGFCVIDVDLLDAYWGATGNSPRTHTFPTCNFPQELDDDGLWMIQGIGVGWADIYGWNLADQYIDITGLPDGVYELVQVANPNGSILEETAADNCAATVIRLEGDDATPISYKEQVSCP